MLSFISVPPKSFAPAASVSFASCGPCLTQAAWIFVIHGSSIKRVLNYTSFALSAALLAPFVVKQADAVYVSAASITTPVPEPGTMGLLAMGLVGLTGAGFIRRRKK